MVFLLLFVSQADIHHKLSSITSRGPKSDERSLKQGINRKQIMSRSIQHQSGLCAEATVESEEPKNCQASVANLINFAS
jgi:hypothetical protein